MKVGETLDAALDAHQVARAFGKSVKTIHGWHKAGKLRKFELRQPMGTKRWSGRKLQDFLDAERTAMSLARSA